MHLAQIYPLTNPAVVAFEERRQVVRKEVSHLLLKIQRFLNLYGSTIIEILGFALSAIA